MLKGPDLSKWQGNIDFTKLKNEADFVIFRSSYGLQSKDPKFYDYVTEAKKVGLPILGVYHFCYAISAQQAEQEALNAIEAVEKAGLDKNTIIFYDLEYDSVENAKKRGIIITRKECNEFTLAFCHKVKTKGYRAGVYFNKDYYKTMYDQATLNQYIKWLAEYRSTPTYNCHIQQVSSTTTVSGIAGHVDWNYLWDDTLLKKEDEKMNEEEFYKQFVNAMGKYRSMLRASAPADWSKEAREFCVREGIFRGDGEENFQWNDFLTREQAAQLIYNQHLRDSKQ